MEQARGPQVVAALLALIRQRGPSVTNAQIAAALDQYSDRELLAYPEFQGDPAAVSALRRWATAHREGPRL